MKGRRSTQIEQGLCEWRATRAWMCCRREVMSNQRGTYRSIFARDEVLRGGGERRTKPKSDAEAQATEHALVL